MMNFKKVTLAMVALGGTMMMAAPAALADGLDLSAAGSYQTQDGTGSYGSQLNQSSSISAGQLSADCYTNYVTSNGGVTSNATFNADGTLVSTDNNHNYGGSTWTDAQGFDTQGASVSTSQSQVLGIGGNDIDDEWFNANGGQQSSMAGALSGSLSYNGIGGGVSLGVQEQDGSDATGAQLSQTSNYNTGTTSAMSFGQHTVNNGGWDTQNVWNSDGTLTSTTTTTSYGGTNSTQAYGYSNNTAGATQDSSQTVGYSGAGGYQDQGAIAATGFWNGFLF